MKKIFGLIFLFFLCYILLVHAVDYITDPNTWTSSRYTVYYEMCMDLKSKSYDCSINRYLGKTTFIALLERQSVVIYEQGSFVKRIDNCYVFDSENWYCETGGTNNESLSMVNGIIWESQGNHIAQQIAHLRYLQRALFSDDRDGSGFLRILDYL